PRRPLRHSRTPGNSPTPLAAGLRWRAPQARRQPNRSQHWTHSSDLLHQYFMVHHTPIPAQALIEIVDEVVLPLVRP
ncbi:MAG: hypothetical protein ACRDTX_18510, partial [Pseudonocardiaceae bacterium]